MTTSNATPGPAPGPSPESRTSPESRPARTIHLSFSGRQAAIRPDGFSPSGHVLEIGGSEQSHVDLADPTHLFYEYLRRIGNLIDAIDPPGAPLTAAHLGAGGLTLPRYLQATRPGSRQVAVEIERELISLVTSELPLPEGTRLTAVHDDARAALPSLASRAGLAEGEGFDVVVLDIFSGADAPEHLACAEHYREILALLSPRGVLAVNIGDDPGLRFFADQLEHLAEAAEPTGGVWTLAETGMLEAKTAGNLILAAGPGLDPRPAGEDAARAWAARIRAEGPHPASCLTPEQSADLLRTLRTRG